jgi:cupin 2 domain-containing protein
MKLPVQIQNLLADLPDAGTDERFELIASNGQLLIERIVSQGQSTPAGEWCCQERDEWVMVLTGRAELKFEGQTALQKMEAGDSVLILGGCRHRVEWTDPDQKTVWLAVHYYGKKAEI